MAQYNVWQNNQLRPSLDVLSKEELTRDRGAFFGSIFGTLNHILWADTIWLHRFGAGPEPRVDARQHTQTTADLADWHAERTRIDANLAAWAASLTQAELDQDLVWSSKLSDREQTTPMGIAAVHVFNHQTHHRGQVHAMLTSAGQPAPVSDLPYLPENST